MRNTFYVKKEITPRGDGNVNPSLAFKTFALVKKEITPRGDGNYIFLLSPAGLDLPVKKEITPRGDGNYCLIRSL